MLERLLFLMDALNNGWKVFFLSMFPISELRVSIPLGFLWGMEPLSCFIWAFCGNIIPIIPILLILPLVYKALLKLGLGGKTLTRILERFRRRGRQVERYGLIGLALFVAIPLPGTGIWTACLIAFLFGLNQAKAAVAIALGAFMAGILVTLASMGALALYRAIYGLEYLAILALIILLIYLWRKKHNIK